MKSHRITEIVTKSFKIRLTLKYQLITLPCHYSQCHL